MLHDCFQANFNKIEDDKAFVTLIEEEVRDCKVVELKKQNFPIHIAKTLEYSESAEHGIADMVEIDELNSASLLYNLKNRYAKDEIYTYVGPILLVLNPFKKIPAFNDEEKKKELKDDYREFVTTTQPF